METLPNSRATAPAASGKTLAVAIDLEMEWSKKVPQHTDKDFLAVQAILFKRIWRVQAPPPNNSLPVSAG